MSEKKVVLLFFFVVSFGVATFFSLVYYIGLEIEKGRFKDFALFEMFDITDDKSKTSYMADEFREGKSYLLLPISNQAINIDELWIVKSFIKTKYNLLVRFVPKQLKFSANEKFYQKTVNELMEKKYGVGYYLKWINSKEFIAFREISLNKEKKVLEREGEFIGGEEDLIWFASTYFSMPRQAQELSISGTMVFQFVVEKNGVLSDLQVVKNSQLGYGLEKEGIRVLKLTSGLWRPAIKEGKPVKSYWRFPFQIENQ